MYKNTVAEKAEKKPEIVVDESIKPALPSGDVVKRLVFPSRELAEIWAARLAALA